MRNDRKLVEKKTAPAEKFSLKLCQDQIVHETSKRLTKTKYKIYYCHVVLMKALTSLFSFCYQRKIFTF